MALSSSPLLGIRMSSVLPPSQTDGMDHETLMDSLDVMITQEASYSCEDYLSRDYTAEEKSWGESKSNDVSAVDLNLVDASCREKMGEWSYRVCDHFKVPRNIVAVAFSFLDRFVNRCSCDRTAFKLASMTALYMATKIFNGRQLSIATLAELSRGEFEASHISEMEAVMLKNLNWKLNPPIVQDFIQFFITLLPSHCPRKILITQRAMFFAELSVYDYDLLLHDRGVIALASIFNAIDAVIGVEDPLLANELEHILLNAIRSRYSSCCSSSGFDRMQQPSGLVQSTQRRLWYLYSCSAQAADDKAVVSDKADKSRKPNNNLQKVPGSPTSVFQVVSVVSPVNTPNKRRY
mmetsp:Transcript_2267/g.3124  ORF Transcript_2267/g.3124 Transcript_2267/m.3124 type:complete len:350 (-) Transcript_2267:218-1267(-)|eukprot:CAMPEP_0198147276 /NCGR_PEP_ID=MMETSP1443-20131203/34379_1 /TAXON_ID=186043 /ORGANISM="Entomoneis sp., Strain CCMP2396" /LENGTH=349 /DNA_ID=CAMNT_0043811527 /DNA_START=103 /DNA_END=1152 /DNA_ORIENTATION=-